MDCSWLLFVSVAHLIIFIPRRCWNMSHFMKGFRFSPHSASMASSCRFRSVTRDMQVLWFKRKHQLLGFEDSPEVNANAEEINSEQLLLSWLYFLPGLFCLSFSFRPRADRPRFFVSLECSQWPVYGRSSAVQRGLPWHGRGRSSLVSSRDSRDCHGATWFDAGWGVSETHRTPWETRVHKSWSGTGINCCCLKYRRTALRLLGGFVWIFLGQFHHCKAIHFGRIESFQRFQASSGWRFTGFDSQSWNLSQSLGHCNWLGGTQRLSGSPKVI